MELGQREAVFDVHEADLDALAYGDIFFFLRVHVLVNQIGGDAEAVAWVGMINLFVEFDEDDWVGRPVAESGQDAVRDYLVAVNRALAADLFPSGLHGGAPGAGGSGLAAQEAAVEALLEGEFVFVGGVEVALVLGVLV